MFRNLGKHRRLRSDEEAVFSVVTTRLRWTLRDIALRRIFTVGRQTQRVPADRSDDNRPGTVPVLAPLWPFVPRLLPARGISNAIRPAGISKIHFLYFARRPTHFCTFYGTLTGVRRRERKSRYLSGSAGIARRGLVAWRSESGAGRRAGGGQQKGKKKKMAEIRKK